MSGWNLRTNSSQAALSLRSRQQRCNSSCAESSRVSIDEVVLQDSTPVCDSHNEIFFSLIPLVGRGERGSVWGFIGGGVQHGAKMRRAGGRPGCFELTSTNGSK